MSLRAGDRLGRYEILAPLGAGGMGEVYRALDTRLKREVALKILPPDLVTDADRKRRFLVEAQSAAALSHPRIATVYDVDEIEGCCYLAMELVAGAPLTERLRSGPLPAAEALALAVEVGEGLACAHSKGIVHRDVKPGNVMVGPDGCVKLIDFGLAKLLEPASGETRTDLATRAGRVVGTPAYMAPEQARGAAVDARADIFSFGLLLYELLTGHRPFDRQSWPETIAAVLRDPVPPLVAGTAGLAPGALFGLQRLLDRCLAKETAARPASMAEVIGEMHAIRRMADNADAGCGAAATDPPSIVVLPFENLSPDPDNAYFADGLTEEITSDLCKVRALRVVSRTSAMRYKATPKSLPEIAAELKVRYVLEGSVRKAGTSLRVTAQFIDAATDVHLWSEKYTGTLDDVFDMQESVSRAIVEALRVHLSPVEQARLTRRAVPDAAVYDRWLRARSAAGTYDSARIEVAISDLQSALGTAKDSPLLMATLAWLHCHSAMMGLGGSGAYDLAESWAKHALDLDNTVSQAHLTLALVEIVGRGRPREALSHAKRALALDPSDPDTNLWMLYTYVGVGRHREALAHARALKAMNPDDPVWDIWLALPLLCDGRTDELISVMEKTRQDLSIPHRRWVMAYYAGWIGQPERAAALLDPVSAGPTFDSYTQQCLLLQAALAGDRAAFDRALVPEFVETARLDGQEASTLGEYYSLLGDHDAAIDWLEVAVSRGWINYPLYARTDPFLEPLRSLPRFREFLERVRVLWERFDE